MTNGGDSAHPEIETVHSNDWSGCGEGFSNTYSTGGLSKREYFAAMAMDALIVNPDWAAAVMKKHGVFDEDHCAREFVVEGAVSFADALIEALNKEPK